MKTKFSGILTLLLAFVVQFTFAQEKTISGTVSDNNGIPLPGVNIIKKGTTTGTQTDFDGNYSINASMGDELTFSYLGLKPVVQTVGISSTINVTMQEDANVLEEVVVTGVATGTLKKKVGVAVNSVKAEDLQDAGSNSIEDALQGKIAGTTITSTSGTPGQQANIIIRSVNFLDSSQPMILIDGIQILTTSNGIGGGNSSGRLSDIDFTDIERVETISGAAAGTIYGAQGANGVINIITKKGKAGKTQVSIRSNFGIVEGIADSGFDRAQVHNLTTNAAGFVISTVPFTQPDGTVIPVGTPVTNLDAFSRLLQTGIEQIDVNGTQIGIQGINNKPFLERTFKARDVIFNTAYNQKYGVTVSGGSEIVNYLVSGNRTEQESVIAEGKLIRYDGRIKVGMDLSDKLSIDTRIDLITTQNDTGNGDRNTITDVYRNFAFVDYFLRNSDGDFVVTPDFTNTNSSNPFFQRDRLTRSENVNRIITNLNINYDPWDFLHFNIRYGYDRYDRTFTSFLKNVTPHLEVNDLGSIAGTSTITSTSQYLQNLLVSANLNLDFNKQFGWNTKFVSNTTVNFDWRDQFFSQSSVTGSDNPIGDFGSFNINQSVNKIFNGLFESPFRTYGFLVNQKFDYGSLFGFSAGFRTDFSNRFGEDLDFTFPRFDAYFNIADIVNVNALKLFKIRAAWGEAGQQPGFAQNLQLLSSNNLGNGSVATNFPAPIGNPQLRVQRTQELELGIDYRINVLSGSWFSRVYGSINYFDKTSEDVIFTVETPPSTGTSSIRDNAYGLASNGIEINFDSDMYTSDNFKWNFGLRFSNAETRLDFIENGLPLVVGGNFALEEGQKIGTFSVNQILTSLDQLNQDGTRAIPLADVNNFTIVPESGYVVDKNTGRVQFASGREIGGVAQPDFILTFLNDFKFNDFISLGFQLDWSQGGEIYNQGRQWLFQNQQHKDVANEITIEDPSGTLQTGAFGNYYLSLYNTNEPTSEFIEDGTFLRLRSISVSFQLNKIFKLDAVKDINLTFTGRNLITISDYKGLDPEAATTFGSTFQRGFDNFSVPNNKSFNFSLNINF